MCLKSASAITSDCTSIDLGSKNTEWGPAPVLTWHGRLARAPVTRFAVEKPCNLVEAVIVVQVFQPAFLKLQAGKPAPQQETHAPKV